MQIAACIETMDQAAEVLAAGDLLTRVEKTLDQYFSEEKIPINAYRILLTGVFLHIICSALERDDVYQELLTTGWTAEPWLAKHRSVFAVYRPWQKYVPWLGQQIVKGVRGIEAILPYVRPDSEPNFWALLEKNGTAGLSLQHVIDDFAKKKNVAVLQGEVVQKLSNGWTLQKLTTKEQLTQEGQILNHCVGGYWADVREGKTEIYSVRDETETPQATIEWKKKSIQQIYGKSDTAFPELDAVIQRHIREAIMGFFKGNFSGRRLMNDKFTAEEMEKLAGDDDPDVRYWVAKHPNTPISALEKLAGDEDPSVRLLVAQHSNTPIRVLEKLAGDDDPDVRYWVAENPNTPSGALEKLAGDDDSTVRYGVAQHPNTPISALEKLAGDEDPSVRLGVAKHPNTSIRVLEKLAGDEKPGVRYWVAENPNTPIRVLEKLAGDEKPGVRYWVAENPNTPIRVLEKLAGDKDLYVSRAARDNLAQRKTTGAFIGTTKVLAADLDADQIAILQLFKRVGRDSLTVREIEQSPVGATPWFRKYLQETHPKKTDLVTIEDVRGSELRTETLNETVKKILQYVDDETVEWTGREKFFNDRQNDVFLVSIDIDDVEEAFGHFGEDALTYLKRYCQYAEQSGHPYVADEVTIGWVRYTTLDDGTIWIDEVQTDLQWILGMRLIQQRDYREAMRHGDMRSKEANYYIRDRIKERQTDLDREVIGVEWYLLRRFMQTQQAEGAPKIVMPTVEYRQNNYPRDTFGDIAAPVTIYNDYPRRMRFKKQPATNIDEDIPPGDVWVFASVEPAVALLERAAEKILAFSVGRRRRFRAHRAARDLGRRLDNQRAKVATDRSNDEVLRKTGLDPRKAEDYRKLRQQAE